MCFLFQGISPKLEFSTKTDIRDSFYPQWDATGDALEYSRVSMTYELLFMALCFLHVAILY